MNRGIHSPPRLVALVACALAVVAAVGAVSPRLRASGRDRVIRAGVARASTLRTDGSRGWVAPVADHDLEFSEAPAIPGRHDGPPGDVEGLFTTRAHGATLQFHPALPSARLRFLPARPHLRLAAGLIRAAAGRAPPLA